MTLLIDPPQWPGHGRHWSHLVSDTSIIELHEFASLNGVPVRLFERDHYDIPSDWYELMVAAGAHPASSKVIVRALIDAGLRQRKPRPSAPA